LSRTFFTFYLQFLASMRPPKLGRGSEATRPSRLAFRSPGQSKRQSRRPPQANRHQCALLDHRLSPITSRCIAGSLVNSTVPPEIQLTRNQPMDVLSVMMPTISGPGPHHFTKSPTFISSKPLRVMVECRSRRCQSTSLKQIHEAHYVGFCKFPESDRILDREHA